jgi:DNA-binding transcriptional ArsR family regulator
VSTTKTTQIPTPGSEQQPLPTPVVGSLDELTDLDPATHEFLKALASPTRQQIMLLFARGAELSVNEIAERAGIGQSTASTQLAILRRGGVVTSDRHGKVVRYRANREGTQAALSDLQRYLSMCC